MAWYTFWRTSGLYSIGRLLFNIFICDLFMFLPYGGIVNYADDNTPYSTCNGIQNIISDLEKPQAFYQNGLVITI